MQINYTEDFIDEESGIHLIMGAIVLMFLMLGLIFYVLPVYFLTPFS